MAKPSTGPTATTTTASATATSAPGKVLLAGGYLVLDRKHTGLVFGLDARVHVVVSPGLVSGDSGSGSERVGGGGEEEEILVQSPQFLGAEWRYCVRVGDGDGEVRVTQVIGNPSTSKNAFVETALAYALAYIHALDPSRPLGSTVLTILADDDYYSSSSTSSPTKTSSKFTNFAVPLSSAHKTGLGSSAALVTAITAALLAHHLSSSSSSSNTKFSLTDPTSLTRLHNLAQASHSAAQGKIGSGFDVASAVYGSCVYRRFSPSFLADLEDAGSPGFAARLQTCVEREWDVQVEKSRVRVPRGLRLVMCDVDCGSQTPGMVREVLAWRAQEGEVANGLWARLQRENDGLAGELVRLANTDADAGSADQGEGKEGHAGYEGLRRILGSIRTLTREMSERSGVPIEPPAQTRLLDACSEVPGVVGGVIPGAGGFDAAALLIEDRAEVVEALDEVLKGWTVDDGVGGGRVRLLGVREEMRGVKVEGVERYMEWV